MKNAEDQRIIVVSGPIAVGKSSIVGKLIESHDFKKLSSGAYLSTLAREMDLGTSRFELVKLGDQLDEDTDFSWVVDKVAAPALLTDRAHSRWIFDSARKVRQLEHFRTGLPDRVFHVHFTADEETLRHRYEARNRGGDKALGYSQAIDTANERESRSLRHIADLKIDTSIRTVEELACQTTEAFEVWSK